MSRRSRLPLLVVLSLLCAAAFLWDWFLMQVMILLHMNDFGKFYYSAQAFLNGQDMYAPTPATDVGIPGLPFLNMNPPHFHLLVLPLAFLAPATAGRIWMAVSLFALTLSVILIAREVRIRLTPARLLLIILAALVFSATQTFFITGQLSLLILLPITACWIAARHGRWTRAAAWLGICLSVKPFLLIFVPYLIWSRRIGAAAIALAVAAAGFVVGIAVFGADSYRSWLAALNQSASWAWAGMNASPLGILERAFTPTPLFAPLVNRPSFVVAWMAASALIGIATLLVVFTDTTRASIDRAFALLLVSGQLVSPLGWVYYLWLPVGPIAALIGNRESAYQITPGAFVEGIAVAGLVMPPVALYFFQPHGWATVTLGSAYFWATLAVWILLVRDFVHSR